LVVQSWAEPWVAVVAGVHFPPVAETSSHWAPAVPALESATPQQIWLPGQSDFWTHLKVASVTLMPRNWVVGHVALGAMQVPAPLGLMQQMLLFRSHGVPHSVTPASSNWTLVGTRPDPPPLLEPPESACPPLDDDVDPELDDVEPEPEPELELLVEEPLPPSSPKPSPPLLLLQAARPAVTKVPVTRKKIEK
jgi:hypothetical protein